MKLYRDPLLVYVPVPHSLLRSGKNISPYALRLYATMKMHAQLGNSWPGMAVLVKEMGVSKTVIYRAVAELAAKNVMRRQPRGPWKSYLYKLFDPVEYPVTA